MIDALGNKLKKGDFIICLSYLDSDDPLLPGVVLNVSKSKVKIIRAAKRRNKWELTSGKSNRMKSNRLCKVDKLPDKAFVLLDMAYEVYWEPR